MTSDFNYLSEGQCQNCGSTPDERLSWKPNSYQNLKECSFCNCEKCCICDMGDDVECGANCTG